MSVPMGPSPGLPPELLDMLGMMGGPPAPVPAPAMGPLDVMGMPPDMPMPDPMAMGIDPAMMGMLPPEPQIPDPSMMDPNFGQDVSMYYDDNDTVVHDPDEKPKKPKRPKPDMDEVREKSDQIVDFWAARDTRMKEDWDLYKMSKTVLGDGEIVIKNTPYVTVEKAANILASQIPQISVIPPSNAEANEAQKVEDFLRWSMDKWNKRWRRSQLQGSMRHAMAHYLCLRGWVAARLQYEGEEEENNYKHHPIHVKLFDPLQVYPALGDNGLRYVAHRYWTTYGELSEEWEEAAELYEEENQEDHVEVTVYYDDWYFAVYAGEDDIIDVTEHEYGFVPWVIVTGNGSPIRATDTNQTSWVADVGVSIFHGMKESYKSLNRVLSQLATQVSNAADPPTAYYYDPVQNANPQPLDMSPGATNFLFYDRERVEPIQLSANPSDVMPLIDSLQDDLNRSTLPSILWGVGGTESGFQTSILTDAARDSLYAIISGMQETMEQINESALTLLKDHHDEPVGFWIKNQQGEKIGGITLDPEEIRMVGVENEVRYRDVSPKDRATMAQLAMGLTNAKLISMETARDEYLGLENPQRENERVLADMIYMDEDVMKKGMIPAALLAQDPALYEMYMALTQMPEPPPQPGAMPNPEGLPPGPPQPGGPPPPGGPEMMGLPPGVQPPVAAPGADLLLQSLGSALGGAGLGPPPGVSGVPLGLPIGL